MWTIIIILTGILIGMMLVGGGLILALADFLTRPFMPNRSQWSDIPYLDHLDSGRLYFGHLLPFLGAQQLVHIDQDQ